MAKPCNGTAAPPRRNHVMANYNIGILYDNGRGVRKDPVEAVEWMRKAAALGEQVATYYRRLL